MKFVLAEVKHISKSINSLQVVRGSMGKAISKIKDDTNLRNKRVEEIKLQTAKVKLEFKQEMEQYLKDEQEYNVTHQKLVVMEEYIRNSQMYIRDKEKERRAETNTNFRSLSPAEAKDETANIHQRLQEEAAQSSIFEEKKVRHIKSLDRLPQKEFFKKRYKKNTDGLYPAEQTRYTTSRLQKNNRFGNSTELATSRTDHVSRYSRLSLSVYL